MFWAYLFDSAVGLRKVFKKFINTFSKSFSYKFFRNVTFELLAA